MLDDVVVLDCSHCAKGSAVAVVSPARGTAAAAVAVTAGASLGDAVVVATALP